MTQKFSSSQALLLPLISQYARCRPSGDGIAHPNPQPFHPLDQPCLLGVSRNGLTIPFRSTFTSFQVFSVVRIATHMLFPSPAQSAPPISTESGSRTSIFEPSARERMLRTEDFPGRLPEQRYLPSGDRFQPEEPSTLTGKRSVVPLTGSNLKTVEFP